VAAAVGHSFSQRVSVRVTRVQAHQGLSCSTGDDDDEVEVGPLAGDCPSCADERPVPLVVSPSLPAAVDLSTAAVHHAAARGRRADEDDRLELPLNLSVTCHRRAAAPPPPAHCHRPTDTHGVTVAASTGTTAAGASGRLQTDDALRSLNVLSAAAAALRAETLDQRLALTAAAADTLTSSSVVDIGCRQVT